MTKIVIRLSAPMLRLATKAVEGRTAVFKAALPVINGSDVLFSSYSSSSDKQSAKTPLSNFEAQRKAIRTMPGDNPLLQYVQRKPGIHAVPPPNPEASSGKSKPPVLRAKTPSDSALTTVLPFSTDETLRSASVNPGNELRFGVLLEYFDSFAGDIAYKHSDGFNPSRPLTLVTAAVDRIAVSTGSINPNQDLRFDGRVTWVGRSSMEIGIDVRSVPNAMDSKSAKVLDLAPVSSASFVFVAMDPASGKPAPVHPLEPTNRSEASAFARGDESKARRRDMASKSLAKLPPNAEERFVIHDLFVRSQEMRKSAKGLDGVSMNETRLESTSLMHPQERNIHNKIFGGHLMRKSFELAFVTAQYHAGPVMAPDVRPRVRSCDEIHFVEPVEIGSVLRLVSRVVYTAGPCVQVGVEALVVDPITHRQKTTNVFHYTFKFPSEVPEVFPHTYAEAMRYLEGRRKYHQGLEQDNRSK